MDDRAQRMGRYELKYWVDDRLMRRVLSFLRTFVVPDPHMPDGTPYTISSLYFDTADYSSYYEKYNGDNRRNKYRIRFYNHDTSHLFFEIKSKRGSFVTKIRRDCRNTDPIAKVVRDLKEGRYDDIVPEFAYYTHLMDLTPTVWTSYKRLAYVGRNNPKLRVTFDDALAGEAADVCMGEHLDFQPLAFSRWTSQQVMEIKFDRFFPFWLESLMRELNIAQESISKYGMVMKKYLFLAKEPAWTH